MFEESYEPEIDIKCSFFGGAIDISIDTNENDLEARLRLGHVREDSGWIQDYEYFQLAKKISQMVGKNARQRRLFREIMQERRHREGLIRVRAHRMEEARPEAAIA